MFCLIDVSGSMSEVRKDIAKRFFILLPLFLLRACERIEVVSIRHHVHAKEVDEQESFHARESGGTIVSRALDLMREITAQRYPASEWNIYGAQASDGENWGGDSELCRDLLLSQILPSVQYYAYVEVSEQGPQSLWTQYAQVADCRDNFAMQQIRSVADIYPVFRKLLVKRSI